MRAIQRRSMPLQIPSFGQQNLRVSAISPGSNSNYLESKAAALLAMLKDATHSCEIYMGKLGLSTQTWGNELFRKEQ